MYGLRYLAHSDGTLMDGWKEPQRHWPSQPAGWPLKTFIIPRVLCILTGVQRSSTALVIRLNPPGQDGGNDIKAPIVLFPNVSKGSSINCERGGNGSLPL